MESAARKLGGLVKGSFKGIRVTQPRRLAADRGRRGRRLARARRRPTGATLRARLGLFDTWAYFTAISGETADGPPAATTAPRSFSFLRRRAGDACAAP